jgi:hypothetical protein
MLNPTQKQLPTKSDQAKAYLLKMLLIFALALYLHEAVGGVSNEVDQGTGLFGYLVNLELILFFGHTFTLLNYLCLFLVGGVHLFLGVVCVLVALKAVPFLPRRGLFGILAGILASVPLLLSSLVAYQIEVWGGQRALSVRARHVDLDAQPSVPAMRDGFIELAGWWDERDTVEYSYMIPSRRERQVVIDFVPVVAKDWTAASPIRYFKRSFGTFRGNHRGSYSSSAPLLPEITKGELTRRLPYYVIQQLRAKQLKIDPSYAVIETRPVDSYDIAQDRYEFLVGSLVCTLLATICICVLFSLGVGTADV